MWASDYSSPAINKQASINACSPLHLEGNCWLACPQGSPMQLSALHHHPSTVPVCVLGAGSLRTVLFMTFDSWGMHLTDAGSSLAPSQSRWTLHKMAPMEDYHCGVHLQKPRSNYGQIHRDRVMIEKRSAKHLSAWSLQGWHFVLLINQVWESGIHPQCLFWQVC